MDPIEVIKKHYAPYPVAMELLVEHSRMVAKKALEAARAVGHMGPDLGFVEEAAMLHDIGMLYTNAPMLGCSGEKPYICHGYLGRQLLEAEGLLRHALVAERHVGVGLTEADISGLGFPIPQRDMTPQSLEEIIVCYADKFYSKDREPGLERPLDEVRAMIRRYGEGKLKTFDAWASMFGDVAGGA